MSTSPEADAVRLRASSKWTQPIPPRADENIKLVQRKIDHNLKLAQPGVPAGATADRMRLPGAPTLMARLAQPGQAAADDVDERVDPTQVDATDEQTEPSNEQADPTDEQEEPEEPVDVLARAREQRLAQQWEDVTARLLRDFAPAGGPAAEAVLTHIAEQRSVLDSATVRDYLPVLVEREVRRILDPDETERLPGRPGRS